MPPSDTSRDVEAVQLDICRRHSGTRRVAIAFEMSLLARELASAGIRRDQPEWSEPEVMREVLLRQFPPDQVPLPLC